MSNDVILLTLVEPAVTLVEVATKRRSRTRYLRRAAITRDLDRRYLEEKEKAEYERERYAYDDDCDDNFDDWRADVYDPRYVASVERTAARIDDEDEYGHDMDVTSRLEQQREEILHQMRDDAANGWSDVGLYRTLQYFEEQIRLVTEKYNGR